MSEPSTTEPETVTMTRDQMTELVNRAYQDGWTDARHWPNRISAPTIEISRTPGSTAYRTTKL